MSQGAKSGERAGHFKSPQLRWGASGSVPPKQPSMLLKCEPFHHLVGTKCPVSPTHPAVEANSCNMFTYRSEFSVTVTSFSSKNQRPMIPAEEIAHHTVILGECKGLWCNSRGLVLAQLRIFMISLATKIWHMVVFRGIQVPEESKRHLQKVLRIDGITS
jgi:hypothetical protein